MTRPSQSLNRSAEPGIDLLRIRGESILTWYRTWKGSPDGEPLVPAESLAAHRLGLYLEYHPRVRYYQRADVTRSFATEHGLDYVLPFPVAIPYLLDGERHDYYADFQGLLDDGRLFVAEAGLAREKSKPASLAKAAAAREFVLAEGGEYWIGTASHISDKRYDSLKMLHSRRLVHGEPPGIAPVIREYLLRSARSVREVVRDLKGDFPAEVIEAVAWRLLGEAHAAGRLLFDFDDEILTIDSAVRLRPDTRPLLLPPELPSSLDDLALAAAAESAASDGEAATVIDADDITDERERMIFLRNIAIHSAVRNGTPVPDVARIHGVSPRLVRYLLARYAQHGEWAFVRRATYTRPDTVDPAFRHRIDKMIRSAPKVSSVKIAESPELEAVARQLARERDSVVPVPTIKQIRRIRNELNHSGAELDRAEKGKRPRRWAGGGEISHVHRIPYPGALAEVDEHYMDVLVAVKEFDVAIRVFAGVLVCVKTGCPLAAVLSPSRLTEADYMRLVRMALEPKDRLKERFGFESDWPCTAKVAAIASDNAWNFTSQRARDVLVKRLNITQAIVPPGSPSAKGTAESILGFLTRRFGHRLPGTLMGKPEDRGDYDSEAAALRAGITFEELEALFYRALVDGYLQDWDDTRGRQRIMSWRQAVEQHGAPQFTGSRDELKLLMLKAANRKNPRGKYRIHHGGLSFLSEWYRSSAEDVARLIRDREVDLYYDPRDIVTIYVGVDGMIVGSLTAPRLRANYVRISEWELGEIRKRERPLRAAVRAGSRRNMRGLYREAATGKRERQRAARALERARAHDIQSGEIHTEAVIVERARALREGERRETPPPAPVVRHGPDNVVPVTRLPVARLPTKR